MISTNNHTAHLVAKALLIAKFGESIESMNQHPYDVSDRLGITDVEMLLDILRTHGKRVKRLALNRFSITEFQFSAVVNLCPNLEWIIMSRLIGDEGFAPIRRLNRLKKLYLSGCTLLTDAALDDLKGLPLQKLGLVDCRFTDAGLESLKGHTSLEKLDLSGCPVSDEGMKHLKPMVSLQKLSLFGCTRVTAVGFRHLEELPRLQEVSYSRIPNMRQVEAAFTKWKFTWSTL